MNVKTSDINALVEMAMKLPGRTLMRPVVEKELLHYDILFILDKEGLMDHLTFQGGTSLRLCYGAPRYSEDLDFAGGKEFERSYVFKMKDCLEYYIGERYGLVVKVKEPKEISEYSENRELRIDKWQISVTTAPEKKDLLAQKIKIEVSNIPAYTRVPRTMTINYDFLPDGYGDTLIMTESLDEVMADKLVSLVDCQRYIRYRDIWDLRWLIQQGAAINSEFIKAKINDYKVVGYINKLDDMIRRIEEIVNSKEFSDQMNRFITLDVLERTLKKENFKVFLANEIKSLLGKVKEIF